jgi:hypothetical protein
MFKNNSIFVINNYNQVMNTIDSHGQSAAKSLSSHEYEKGSTTISRKESTLEKVEKAHIRFYSLTEKLPIVSGIYGIYCLVNDKMYIGSAINIHARFIKHKYYLKSRKHHSLKLQRAYDKYGIENFKIAVLEVCHSEELLDREFDWISKLDSYKNGFNCTDVCKKPKNFKLSELQIAKRTQQSSKPVICLDLEGVYLNEYSSISKAAEAIKDQSTNISSCCKGKLNYVKDYIFVYKSEYDPKKDYAYKPQKRVFSKEHKDKIGKALKGRKQSEQNIINLIKRSSKSVIQCDENGNEFKYYSLKECCLTNQLYVKTLKKHIVSKTPLGGFLYRFDEDIV